MQLHLRMQALAAILVLQQVGKVFIKLGHCFFFGLKGAGLGGMVVFHITSKDCVVHALRSRLHDSFGKPVMDGICC